MKNSIIVVLLAFAFGFSLPSFAQAKSSVKPAGFNQAIATLQAQLQQVSVNMTKALKKQQQINENALLASEKQMQLQINHLQKEINQLQQQMNRDVNGVQKEVHQMELIK